MPRQSDPVEDWCLSMMGERGVGIWSNHKGCVREWKGECLKYKTRKIAGKGGREVQSKAEK